MSDEPQFLDENHERIVAFATDFLEEDERDEFVDTMMERAGYERISGWGPPADPGGPGRKAPVRRRTSPPGKGQPRHPGFRRPS